MNTTRAGDRSDDGGIGQRAVIHGLENRGLPMAGRLMVPEVSMYIAAAAAEGCGRPQCGMGGCAGLGNR